MCLKSIPLAYQIDFFCIYIYICTLDPTQIVTCAILLMRNRTVRFVPSFQHFDTFRSLPPCPRTSGLILISLPFLLHLTTTRNNAQQCATMHQIHVFNLHVESPHEQNPNTFQVGIPDNVDIVNCKQFAAIQECNEALNRCILQTKIL